MTELIISLDMTELSSLNNFLKQVEGHADFFKIGLAPFLAWGPDLVVRLKKEGKRVFLDLKFFDIPNTVRLATRFACDLGVDMVNLHILGGAAMMEAALAGRADAGGATKIIGVTVLTSFSQEDLSIAGMRGGVQEQVLRFASRAHRQGLDGVVCSIEDLSFIRQRLRPPFITVCPGVRMAGPENDQKRTGTPKEAVSFGADYIVVGRPIIESSDPIAAIQAIQQDLSI